MNANRRQFLQVTATSVVTAAVSTAEAADPFAPALPGLTAKWFDKGRQHVLPVWAFTRPIQVSATPKPITTAPWEDLSGGDSHRARVLPYDKLGDVLPIGKVLHGTAAEWNGKLIGGNMKYDTATKQWSPAASAWAAMRERVTPDGGSPSWKISDVGNWGKFGSGPEDPEGKKSLVRCYRIEMFEKHFPLRQDARFPALLYTYGGMVPGPTFRFRHGMPAVVRFVNKLQTETSIHHHGGHNPTHGDGFPSYYVLQGEARDYLYPNILPLRIHDEATGKTEIDFAEGQSTTWYHDHGLDATAFNVSHGLSGFALWFDDLELNLIRIGVLPGLGDISGTEITISKKEFEKWLTAWRKLKPTGELAGEWRALMLESKVVDPNTISSYQPTDAGWLKDALAIEAAAESTEFKNFYHRRADNTMPGVGTPYFNPYDLPIVLQDRVIDQNTGQIVYDSNGHNGYIGNTQLISGVAWPVCMVKRRKYRLRILDGSNSRIYRLRFLDSATFGLRPNGNPNGEREPAIIPEATLEAQSKEFLRIGKDSWLWPLGLKRKSLIVNMANRADLIVDFKAWYEEAKQAGRLTPEGNAEFYLVNTMPQFDGRGPKTKLAEDAGDPTVFPLPFTVDPRNPVVGNMIVGGAIPPAFIAPGPLGQATELNQPIGLVKFVITPDAGEGEDATIDETSILRPRHRIEDKEVMAVREFVFERGKGAWMINSRFYDPTICNANPIIGIKGQEFKVPSGDPAAVPVPVTKQSLTYAEEWILRNGGGGWWHPIHIHLEGHQLVSYEKDFAADGLVGADGILGAAAQAQMAALPTWDRLVDEFGLGRLQTTPPISALTSIINALTHPKAGDMPPAYVSANPLLDTVLATPFPGTALFAQLRQGPTITAALAALSAGLRGQVEAIIDGLDQLRLQWTGDMVGNHDTQALGPNSVARIRMRFRTWSGPLVFHCHNVEHEDMRMMVNFEATMSGKCSELNQHDPNVAPAARSHGQDVTDLLTNPNAVGELPWEAIDGFPRYGWEEKPVPGTPLGEAGDPLVAPREPQK